MINSGNSSLANHSSTSVQSLSLNRPTFSGGLLEVGCHKKVEFVKVFLHEAALEWKRE